MNHLISRSSAKFYPSLNFLTNDEGLGKEWFEELFNAINKKDVHIFKAENGSEVFFRHLKWDSDFFNVPTYKIEYLYTSPQAKNSAIALDDFFNFLNEKHEKFYTFAEIPSEDVETIIGLTATGYTLIETRLTYFHDQIQKFESARRYPTRQANEGDIPTLKTTAIEAVNIYDRFHADQFFSSDMADNFLAKYVENSVLGYADEVMIPADGNANSFLTANYISSPNCLSNKKIAKMVLSAVAPERRGWYVKLISEMSLKFKEKEIDVAFMTTQSTNRAVLKVWHSFGYRFGRCTHIFSKYKL
ncbi:MAG: hypothetical protein K0R49_1636 [Burkholderiales bacterium]|jgi:dTDP-4-amino-4,6-dideoxy-D-galactose acyltransferase|nr:hypothetical protein [Burkholderiales bacterium]